MDAKTVEITPYDQLLDFFSKVLTVRNHFQQVGAISRVFGDWGWASFRTSFKPVIFADSAAVLRPKRSFHTLPEQVIYFSVELQPINFVSKLFRDRAIENFDPGWFSFVALLNSRFSRILTPKNEPKLALDFLRHPVLIFSFRIQARSEVCNTPGNNSGCFADRAGTILALAQIRLNSRILGSKWD